MKTFEEKFTAWADGNLHGAELAAFEREMEARAPEEFPAGGPEGQKAEWHKLGDLLRSHGGAPALSNPDFFNHQILHRIAREEEEAVRGRVQRRWWSGRWWSGSLPRLAWAGAACLTVAALLFRTLIPAGSAGPETSPYFAEIVDVRTFSPGISATPVYDSRDNVTVVWLDGLDYLPASYKLQ